MKPIMRRWKEPLRFGNGLLVRSEKREGVKISFERMDWRLFGAVQKKRDSSLRSRRLKDEAREGVLLFFRRVLWNRRGNRLSGLIRRLLRASDPRDHFACFPVAARVFKKGGCELQRLWNPSKEASRNSQRQGRDLKKRNPALGGTPGLIDCRQQTGE